MASLIALATTKSVERSRTRAYVSGTIIRPWTANPTAARRMECACSILRKIREDSGPAARNRDNADEGVADGERDERRRHDGVLARRRLRLVVVAEDSDGDLRSGEHRDDVERHADELHHPVVRRGEVACVDRQHDERQGPAEHECRGRRSARACRHVAISNGARGRQLPALARSATLAGRLSPSPSLLGVANAGLRSDAA